MSVGMNSFDFLMVLQAIVLGAIIVVSYVYHVRAGLIPAAVYVLFSFISMLSGPKDLVFLSTVLVVLGGLYLAKLLGKYIDNKPAMIAATAAIILVLDELLGAIYIAIVYTGYLIFSFGSLLIALIFAIASALGCFFIIMKNPSMLSQLSGKKEKAREVQRDVIVDDSTKLGNNYVGNFIADGSMSNGFAVRSN